MTETGEWAPVHDASAGGDLRAEGPLHRLPPGGWGEKPARPPVLPVAIGFAEQTPAGLRLPRNAGSPRLSSPRASRSRVSQPEDVHDTPGTAFPSRCPAVRRRKISGDDPGPRAARFPRHVGLEPPGGSPAGDHPVMRRHRIGRGAVPRWPGGRRHLDRRRRHRPQRRCEDPRRTLRHPPQGLGRRRPEAIKGWPAEGVVGPSHEGGRGGRSRHGAPSGGCRADGRARTDHPCVRRSRRS